MLSSQAERGAAAVEFAIIVPVLIMLVLGIIEFAWAFNGQVTLTNAAREGVRSMAIDKDQTKARTAAKNAASHLNPALKDGNITFTDFSPDPSKCPTNKHVAVTINYAHNTITGIAGPFPLKARGTMLCGG